MGELHGVWLLAVSGVDGRDLLYKIYKCVTVCVVKHREVA